MLTTHLNELIDNSMYYVFWDDMKDITLEIQMMYINKSFGASKPKDLNRKTKMAFFVLF